jgi:hypothetical protein
MRKIYFLLVFIAMTMMANAQNVNVNPGAGRYPNLASAFAAINAGTHKGNIVVVIVANTAEPAAGAVLNASGSGAASYSSILICPTDGAAITVTGAATPGRPLIDFNGADNVTVSNGLNGSSLTISNTTVSSVFGTCTIQFHADATNNTITDCTVLGSATMEVGSVGGNIVFGPDAIATGNDGNTVSNCNIGPAGANLPSKCIYCFGNPYSDADPGIANSGITITGNNFFDYFSSTVYSAAIDLNHGMVGTVISNNKFYQTAVRTMAANNIMHSAISIGNSKGNGFKITGNTIGFASATGAGTYTIVARDSCQFIPVYLFVSPAGTATSVQGNTIAGIAISGTSSGTLSGTLAEYHMPFCGICVASGLTTVGDITGNTIGSQVAKNSIIYTSSAANPGDVIGIFNFGTSNWVTNNNTVGGITGSSSGTGAVRIYGLYCFTSPGVTWTALNNYIGGSVTNSIQSTSTANGTMVQGIVNNASASTIQGNTVRNLTAAGGTGPFNLASVAGIVINNTSSISHNISRNTVFNLTNTNTTQATTVTGLCFITGINGSNGSMLGSNQVYSLITNTGGATTVTGLLFSGGAGNTVERNMISGLTNTNTTGLGAKTITGIEFSGGNGNTVRINQIYGLNTNTSGASTVTGLQFAGSGTGNTVERNLIYDLSVVTNDINAEVNGIRVNGGSTTYRNNMILIGFGVAKAFGNVASALSVSGINGFNVAAPGTNNFWHNSVYINGNPAAGTGASYAFNSTQTVGNNIRNNIFFNARSNAGGATGRNYAIKLNVPSSNPPSSAYTINNNLYFANGSGGTFGFYNNGNAPALSLWMLALGQDRSSIQADPLFVSATDLHLQPGSPAIDRAFNLGVTNDYDGHSRPGANALYDIGADEKDGIAPPSNGRFTGAPLPDSYTVVTDGANPSPANNRGINKGQKSLALSIEGLFPNPANTSVNVLIGSPVPDKVTLMVVDITGKTVLQQMVNVEEGSNTIPIDISRITSGNYLLKLVCNNCGTSISKFVKQ